LARKSGLGIIAAFDDRAVQRLQHQPIGNEHASPIWRGERRYRQPFIVRFDLEDLVGEKAAIA
jgi:hypothetical protein